MVDTDTAETAECEVRADDCSAEGRGMDAGEHIAVYERAAASELDAAGMLGMAATTGTGEGIGARAVAAVTNGVAGAHDEAEGGDMVDE